MIFLKLTFCDLIQRSQNKIIVTSGFRDPTLQYNLKLTFCEVIHLSPVDSKSPLCYMCVIHSNALTAIIKQIFNDFCKFDLLWPYPKVTGQNTRGFIDSTLYMSVMHPKTLILLSRYLMICLILTFCDLIQRSQSKSDVTSGFLETTFLYVCNIYTCSGCHS